jgi:hypothetical protein
MNVEQRYARLLTISATTITGNRLFRIPSSLSIYEVNSKDGRKIRSFFYLTDCTSPLPCSQYKSSAMLLTGRFWVQYSLFPDPLPAIIKSTKNIVKVKEEL